VVQTFTREFINAARPARHATGDRWFVDETYIRVGGRWTYLYRAVDQYAQVVDVLVSARRDAAAARSFFARALRVGCVPAEVHHRSGAGLPARTRRAAACPAAHHRAIRDG
jgi:transposase, IS6 family